LKPLRKFLDLPFIGPLLEKAMSVTADNEVSQISHHFSKYLRSTIAFSDECKHQSYKIRHKVFCEELKFETIRAQRIETDTFDAHSTHCLIEHIPTGTYAGTVRVIRSERQQQLLPIEKYCISSIADEKVHPNDFPRHEICEISRLAIPAQFRKRHTDRFKSAATGAINQHIYSERELRCFPFIAVGLYLSAASITTHHGINHCFVMMEPRLARSLRYVGIPFEQVGPVVEYHGQRAPYYMSRDLLMKSLSPSFKNMMKATEKQINCQFDSHDN
jgi:N-acyl amino acid synthase of PEP-CTERM/exosortase system